MMNSDVIILGGGPSGLSCAYELGLSRQASLLLERHDRVGGLCRTVEFEGFNFDVGPHRFFTKNDEVDRLWHELLGDQVIHVPRLTRILYKNRFFDYPLKPLAALKGLGIGTSMHAMGSAIWAKAHNRNNHSKASFEDWVVSQFGKVLYEIFFKTYTEKVWGISCSAISAEWAGQRIKGLSLGKAVMHGLIPNLNRKGGVKSLVDQFDYPVKGAGQVYERMAVAAVANGAAIQLNTSAHAILHDSRRITAVEVKRGEKTGERVPVGHLFSSIPLTEFILRLQPTPPDEVLEAARALYYRDHLTVNLVVKRRAPFPDNWIYVHAPEVRMARISSYGNFSEGMLADETKDAIAVEYFTFAHEDLWQMRDDELIQLADKEMQQVGLLSPGEVESGFVMRERDSYPTYYLGYKQNLEVIQRYVADFKNLTLIGRGGMYRYNNQDHAILSGLLAARNYSGTGRMYNLWEINEEDEYLEEKQLPTPMHAGKSDS